MRTILILALLRLTGCDQLSQRIWNCAVDPLKVTKVLDEGSRVNDVIPERSYIASMNGGVQVVALELQNDTNRRAIWRREQSHSGLATSAEQICGAAKRGVVGEQL
jgi:hypothetical protein